MNITLKYNIVFLDIDGVAVNRFAMFTKMVSEKPFSKLDTSDRSWMVKNEHMSKECVWLLKYLMSKIPCGIIVFTSSWREAGKKLSHPVNTAIVKKFQEYGFTNINEYLLDNSVTVRTDKLRGNDIDRWLKDNKEIVSNYIIIDDDSDMLPHQKDRLVLTNGESGFVVQDMRRALELFNIKRDKK